MPRDRFLAIWACLHCVNEEDPQVDKTEKIYKGRPVFNYLVPRFREFFVPQCEMSLDEGMIPTKNKISFRQYIKSKPIKWGIKCFILCDSDTGYIVNAEVYTGKLPDEIPDLGVTGNLVVRLCDLDLIKDQNYMVFTDRFYTTVQLAEYQLKHQGIRLCGTADTRKKTFPK
ncbi:piggyBac transposable element-derived protein 4-like [Lineus longissimus]|uniref:piggyBac transposable element-derived protein 4-like n=1 Tax=Lineus longissimus TaxID=88925 RepID=UPI00315C9AD6